jgi:hypothetical protein
MVYLLRMLSSGMRLDPKACRSQAMAVFWQIAASRGGVRDGM